MIDDTTAHELAAKLHSANGRIMRAEQTRDPLLSETNLSDAGAIIGEVIRSLCESIPPRMPVIRPRHAVTDPALMHVSPFVD